MLIERRWYRIERDLYFNKYDTCRERCTDHVCTIQWIIWLNISDQKI